MNFNSFPDFNTTNRPWNMNNFSNNTELCTMGHITNPKINNYSKIII